MDEMEAARQGARAVADGESRPTAGQGRSAARDKWAAPDNRAGGTDRQPRQMRPESAGEDCASPRGSTKTTARVLEANAGVDGDTQRRTCRSRARVNGGTIDSRAAAARLHVDDRIHDDREKS